jgi:putative membrane protein
MRRVVEILILGAAAALSSGVVVAAEAPVTAEVLGQLHQANQREIDMGQMAQLEGHSKAVKSFGKMLVKDHAAADKKIAKLAREEKITLTDAPAPSSDKDTLPTGQAFDVSFAKMMVQVHQSAISDVKAAHDSTSDQKLQSLLNEILPVLQKHEQEAQRLLDQFNRS